MRHAHEAALVKALREAKGGGVRCRRCCPSAVHPPGHEGQNKDDRNRGYDRHDCVVSVEVSLQWPFSAGVQGRAMKPASQQLSVSQLEWDYIEPLLLQESDQGPLISIHNHRIRIDAEGV